MARACHVFGGHKNCRDYSCNKADVDDKEQLALLSDSKLMDQTDCLAYRLQNQQCCKAFNEPIIKIGCFQHKCSATSHFRKTSSGRSVHLKI
ncbi:hypothetical protein PR048_015012 [Dryococelus australis]|uniref:Uncharacterized protein n=1 Tax=Dryococelus australis TaxID=614101 RepID=A0ABQ9HFR3_9NEOP|nr:hypothetical protein PR048_015012 [Dryococelus australis]